MKLFFRRFLTRSSGTGLSVMVLNLCLTDGSKRLGSLCWRDDSRKRTSSSPIIQRIPRTLTTHHRVQNRRYHEGRQV